MASDTRSLPTSLCGPCVDVIIVRTAGPSRETGSGPAPSSISRSKAAGPVRATPGRLRSTPAVAGESVADEVSVVEQQPWGGSPLAQRTHTRCSLAERASSRHTKYINGIRLERASQKQSSDTHTSPYDRVKQCWERKQKHQGVRALQRKRIHAKQTAVSPTRANPILSLFSDKSSDLSLRLISKVLALHREQPLPPWWVMSVCRSGGEGGEGTWNCRLRPAKPVKVLATAANRGVVYVVAGGRCRRGKREIPEKTHRPVVQSGKIHTRENTGVAWPGIEPVGGEQSNRSATAAPVCQGTGITRELLLFNTRIFNISGKQTRALNVPVFYEPLPKYVLSDQREQNQARGIVPISQVRYGITRIAYDVSRRSTSAAGTRRYSHNDGLPSWDLHAAVIRGHAMKRDPRMERRWICKSGGNGSTSRKPAGNRRRPARFPHAKTRE
ncbi:hypothetical protein PR048_017686 [Dryococelus australis]|uniref:Uncharacterized protein n=1 Tax=Dryococelus australis TaxID=614101 RepID=A0ABQ9HAA3_9NEOP|nr:hypothetical protein PR048_017686 [Dryococelus australis]